MVVQLATATSVTYIESILAVYYVILFCLATLASARPYHGTKSAHHPHPDCDSRLQFFPSANESGVGLAQLWLFNSPDVF